MQKLKTAILIYLSNLIHSISSLANSVTGGDAREPLSSVLGKLRNDERCILCGVFCKILNMVFFMQKADHCNAAVISHYGYGTNDYRGIIYRWSGNVLVALIILLLVFRVEAWAFVGGLFGFL